MGASKVIGQLRERLDTERSRGHALTVRHISVYLILLALERRRDEIRALAIELPKDLKKQFADEARLEMLEQLAHDLLVLDAVPLASWFQRSRLQ